MHFNLNSADVVAWADTLLASLSGYTTVVLSLVVGAGILSRGLEWIRWGGR